MFGQSFVVGDMASVVALVILEALLSADNALVLAILVRHLPREQQKKALLFGLGGAFVFRLIAILFAQVVLQQWWLQAVGAAYLLYLPVKHFISSHKEGGGSEAKPVGAGFWQTVIAVEMTDIAFALDSVLAGIAFITGPSGVKQDKIWVVYLGALIGIVLLRLAAGLFVRLLERFPGLTHVAYLLVGWVGLKLGLHAMERFDTTSPGVIPFPVPHMGQPAFWIGLLLIAGIGTAFAIRYQVPEASSLDPQAEDLTESMQEDPPSP